MQNFNMDNQHKNMIVGALADPAFEFFLFLFWVQGGRRGRGSGGGRGGGGFVGVSYCCEF